MPHKVTVNTGQTNVQLPNGEQYNAGAVVVLTDEQFSKLAGDVFTKNVAPANSPALIDNGPYGITTAVAGDVAAAAALTLVAPGNSATGTQINTAFTEALADLTALRTTLNATLAALKTAGLMS